MGANRVTLRGRFVEIRALASSSRTYLGAQLKGWLELLAKTYLQSSLKHRPISAGVLLASARHARPGQGLQHTRYTLWCTPQPRRSHLSRRFWLCQFIFGLSLSRGVTLVQLVCCFVVRSSSSARGCSGARRLFQAVMIAADSAWGLALSHVGSQCTSGAAAVLPRMGGWTRCAERPPPRPWPSTRRGGAAPLDRVLTP